VGDTRERRRTSRGEPAHRVVGGLGDADGVHAGTREPGDGGDVAVGAVGVVNPLENGARGDIDDVTRQDADRGHDVGPLHLAVAVPFYHEVASRDGARLRDRLLHDLAGSHSVLHNLTEGVI